MVHRSVIVSSLAFALTPAAILADEIKPKISEAQRDDHGFLSHRVESEYQYDHTEIKILLPDRLEEGKRYRVLYVLPVEAGTESRYGHGLLEVKKLDVANKHGVICVLPTFSRLPWYADHPSDAKVRQETYFLKVVLPFIERQYPAQSKAEGRLLLGFSKSGWGAWTLLLRHPDLFGKAAAWDAPLKMERPDRFGMKDIFATQENFEGYRVSSLLERRADLLKKEKRLILTGYDAFRDQHVATHERMERLQIAHEYRDGPKRKHVWDPGWVAEAVKLLVE